jgi:hypothetical protein
VERKNEVTPKDIVKEEPQKELQISSSSPDS